MSEQPVDAYIRPMRRGFQQSFFITPASRETLREALPLSQMPPEADSVAVIVDERGRDFLSYCAASDMESRYKTSNFRNVYRDDDVAALLHSGISAEDLRSVRELYESQQIDH